MFMWVVNLGEPSLPFIHALLWELSELHFHYDLLALNHFINAAMWQNPDACASWQAAYNAILLGEVVGGMWDSPLTGVEVGLFLGNVMNSDYVVCINAFYSFVTSWPNAPTTFSEELTTTSLEARAHDVSTSLQVFYIETFFAYTGRPPVIPRRVPVSG
ncbi:hypothetical protein HYDPIDRAFT_29027 [Hydnomerulius pinastri MD-312]|uniref:Uncharacterized protein n=1 Tax=Hydnomerulius pinastri MD-312 TaxID=994086 RepID=A0A0C9W081_9AGAM|nr:hypothetical protein HYDPIDRAFT_29027 [Hydnomerulius pinastri MD-312]